MIETNNIITPATNNVFMPAWSASCDKKMKTLIDRTCSRYTEINNKEFYFIVTSADNNKQALERTLEEFRGFTTCLDGAKEKGIIYGTGTWNIEDIKKSKALKQACEMGKKV